MELNSPNNPKYLFMRKKIKTKKELLPDSVYNSILLTKFINHLMKRGKKSTAQRIIYDALDELNKISKQDNGISILEAAVKNASPAVEIRSRRIGGANYQVPREVKADRRTFLAIRWLLEAARQKKGKPMLKRLTEELMSASKNEGVAVKKKENTHKMAEANKAFAHFAW